MPVTSIHRPALMRRSSTYGSLDCRFTAFLIDSTLFAFLQSLTIYVLIGYPDTNGLATNLVQANLALFTTNLDYLGQFIYTNFYFLILHWLYYAIMESSRFKGTVGKLVLGLKVTTVSGHRVSFAQASVRYFGKIFSTGLFFAGYLVAFTNPRHQTLHDIIAGCTIRVKRVH